MLIHACMSLHFSQRYFNVNVYVYVYAYNYMRECVWFACSSVCHLIHTELYQPLFLSLHYPPSLPPSQVLPTPTPALSIPCVPYRTRTASWAPPTHPSFLGTACTLSAITQVPQETSEDKAATHRSSAQRREPRDTPTQSLCLFFCF